MKEHLHCKSLYTCIHGSILILSTVANVYKSGRKNSELVEIHVSIHVHMCR